VAQSYKKFLTRDLLSFRLLLILVSKLALWQQLSYGQTRIAPILRFILRIGQQTIYHTRLRNNCQHSILAHSNDGLFRKADLGWRKEHSQWFTRSFTATLPSQWASQVISQNIALAFSKHIQSSISKITTHKSSRTHNTLNTAAIAPRCTRSTYALSLAYFVASALSCR
jgi:hypothetical protein